MNSRIWRLCTGVGNASLGSFIYVQGTAVFSKGQNTSIIINRLSADGSMIKTF